MSLHRRRRLRATDTETDPGTCRSSRALSNCEPYPLFPEYVLNAVSASSARRFASCGGDLRDLLLRELGLRLQLGLLELISLRTELEEVVNRCSSGPAFLDLAFRFRVVHRNQLLLVSFGCHGRSGCGPLLLWRVCHRVPPLLL